jgi:predicted nucleotidyltransferase
VTAAYIERLVTKYPDIGEIWLMGSRANGTHRPDSDWDYFVFGNERILRSLARRRKFHQPDIDPLIVYDGNQFRKPWADGPRWKTGSLSAWQWNLVGHGEATYWATKPREGDDFYVDGKTARARLVWKNPLTE